MNRMNLYWQMRSEHHEVFKDLSKEKLIIRKPGDTIRISNVMRIRLDNSFGVRLKNYDTSNAYKSDSLFKTKFRGLAIKNVNTATPGALPN